MVQHSQPTISSQDINAVKEVLKSKHLSDGIITDRFEKRLCKFMGMRYGIAASSGTAALHLSLLALNLKSKDEIILPSFVCSSLLNAIIYLNAKPVICDIELDNYNLSLEATRKKITKNTKAIILPYMFGAGVNNIDKFLELDIPIVEDCAQSLGATQKNKKIGSFGTVSIFSFYATKVITTGQGGIILTNSRRLFERAEDLIEYDERNDYRVRYNYKMTDLQAALGLAQLKRINSFIQRRRKIAQYYDKIFSKYDIIIPAADPGHIYYRYLVRIRSSIREFILRLRRKGIEAKSPVYKPLHRYLGLSRESFPNTEEVFKTAVSLPIYPSLSGNQEELVAKSVLDSL